MTSSVTPHRSVKRIVTALLMAAVGVPDRTLPDRIVRYIDAVNWTGGTLLNIYDNNWPSALAAIAQQAVADIGVFELGQRNPDPNSVRVWVDGVEQFSGWTYDPARNAVVFDPDPTPNSVVDVTYGVAVNCGP